MRLRDAVELLAGSDLAALGPTTWADLGCGAGTFTLALAEMLASGSAIHAMDRDQAALRRIPVSHNDVRITTHRGDFTRDTWPFADLDGILLANALHYVEDQARFIAACATRLRVRRFLIVEYDTEASNRWVPYPVSARRLTALVSAEGSFSIRWLGTRPSVYQQAALYAALVIEQGREPSADDPRPGHRS
jgi:trans-aconitate methyltransferase